MSPWFKCSDQTIQTLGSCNHLYNSSCACTCSCINTTQTNSFKWLGFGITSSILHKGFYHFISCGKKRQETRYMVFSSNTPRMCSAMPVLYKRTTHNPQFLRIDELDNAFLPQHDHKSTCYLDFVNCFKSTSTQEILVNIPLFVLNPYYWLSVQILPENLYACVCVCVTYTHKQIHIL